jgi:DNA-binding XRE family transcriptional regulator
MNIQPPAVFDLDYHRERCGLTREEVADAVGVSLDTWHKWRRGQVHPSLRHQARLAQLFGMPLRLLWTPIGGVV